MAKSTNTKVDKVKIRMYKGGTGDCFLLQFMKGADPSFNMMIDCGIIKGAARQFEGIAKDIEEQTGGEIHLLVVTHEHADHINGFEKVQELFKEFNFKKVWFAWTEDDEDPLANDYRLTRSELSLALDAAVSKLNILLTDNYYEKLFMDDVGSKLMVEGKKKFINSITSLNDLNVLKAAKGKPLPTMVERFTDLGIIKENTIVELLKPGDVRSKLAGATGIRFYVLAPPRDFNLLNETEGGDNNFDKREAKSRRDFAFLSAVDGAFTGSAASKFPFEAEHELQNAQHNIVKLYKEGNDWRKIDHDWLYSAGSLAMRYERSINNTSLALAIQFEDSERVLLFPADAEFGSWKSWHMNLHWPVKIDGKTVKKDISYFLENTVFYKVGHHLSHNGTATALGLDMMTSDELTAMATLDFAKINDGWLNTMPNDLLGAELIRKCAGKLYVSGDCDKILNNMKTGRVTIKKAHERIMRTLHQAFANKNHLECIIEG
ncbi:MBL fold metallo-hydrolase [Chitinophaga filiformis]|uniref:MBL fold metallo-hydrolase n=1 Tax=Chitinophaga filiformis TaxID=104663 RepID=UPI001F1F3E84|nr:MBL fold metallo-hydrolase [Chitinophaga filiformis]MCF6405987.1 MBL fold metallo-hydrolase [Chitinophaga filiformis]